MFFSLSSKKTKNYCCNTSNYLYVFIENNSNQEKHWLCKNLYCTNNPQCSKWTFEPKQTPPLPSPKNQSLIVFLPLNVSLQNPVAPWKRKKTTHYQKCRAKKNQLLYMQCPQIQCSFHRILTKNPTSKLLCTLNVLIVNHVKTCLFLILILDPRKSCQTINFLRGRKTCKKNSLYICKTATFYWQKHNG